MSTTPGVEPAYLIFNAETVPDGELLRRARFSEKSYTAEEAVVRARAEAMEKSENRSDFVPISFCFPVAVCVARVSADFRLQAITCLDSPQFRPRQIVADFWKGLAHYQAVLVSYNGRSFDLPALEMAAFRFGISARGHFEEQKGRRYRYGGAHLDLNAWLSNYGACPLAGGLDALAKLLGKQGGTKPITRDLWDLYSRRLSREINDICMFDVLDTYFVFLRTRVMTGEIDLDTERERVTQTKDWLGQQAAQYPQWVNYLDSWGQWEPWV